MDREPLFCRQRENRVACDPFENSSRERRCSQRSVFRYEEDIHPAEFLDPFAFNSIEEDSLVAAVRGCSRLGKEASSIIASTFRCAGSAFRRADVIGGNPNSDRLLS